MNRVLLDANILIEVLLQQPQAAACQAVIADQSRQYVISALTVQTIWYVAEKYHLDLDRVDDFLSGWEILPLTANSIQAARARYDGKDFEDCLQAVTAETGQCEGIITLDKHFKSHSHTTLSVTIPDTSDPDVGPQSP